MSERWGRGSSSVSGQEKRGSWEHWGKVICVHGLRRGLVGNTSEFSIRRVRI